MKKEKSKCHGAPLISSGIPFDGTNAEYVKMCKVCDHNQPIPKSYHECAFLECRTFLSEGSPRFCPEHNQFN